MMAERYEYDVLVVDGVMGWFVGMGELWSNGLRHNIILMLLGRQPIL